MRRSPILLASFAFLFVLACSRAPLGPAALCISAAAMADGAIFALVGAASASEAGEPFIVVQRQRTCEDVHVTVTDSAGPPAPRPWVDGDAQGFAVGTVLYQRRGSEPGQELVAQNGQGEWVLLRRQRGT